MAQRDDIRMTVALVYGEFHLPEVKRPEQPIWWKPLQNFRNRVVSYYQTHPGCSIQECADALSISRKTVSRHLKTIGGQIEKSKERENR